MREFLLIGLGAVFGANSRYWLTQLFADRFGLAFPSGTLFINISGSLLLGFLLTLIGQRFVADPGLRLLLGTGFLGAYTTFSTFSYDTVILLERGDWLPALLYAGASLLGSVFAAYVGIVLARLLG
jgi:CrcB protein